MRLTVGHEQKPVPVVKRDKRLNRFRSGQKLLPAVTGKDTLEEIFPQCGVTKMPLLGGGQKRHLGHQRLGKQSLSHLPNSPARSYKRDAFQTAAWGILLEHEA